MLRDLDGFFGGNLEDAFALMLQGLPEYDRSRPETLIELISLVKQARHELGPKAETYMSLVLQKVGSLAALFYAQFPSTPQRNFGNLA